MGRPIGYARVSTGEQDLQLQLDALDKAGCVKVFEDKASGARAKRPGLDTCVAALEPGDTLVVWRLDRLGRSMPHLVSLVEELLGKGIGFRSLLDGAIDTTTASGELMFNIFSRSGAVRAAPHPGAHPGWTRGCPGTRPSRRPQADQGRRSSGRDC